MGDSDLRRQAPALLEALAQPLESTLNLAPLNLVAGPNVGEVFDVVESEVGIARESHPADVRYAARNNMELDVHLLQRGNRKLLVSELGLIVAVFFQQAV